MRWINDRFILLDRNKHQTLESKQGAQSSSSPGQVNQALQDTTAVHSQNLQDNASQNQVIQDNVAHGQANKVISTKPVTSNESETTTSFEQKKINQGEPQSPTATSPSVPIFRPVAPPRSKSTLGMSSEYAILWH